MFFRNKRGKCESPKTEAFARAYQRPPSFADLLPWTTYLPDRKFFVLDDGISVGAALELYPIGTEAVSDDFLIDVRDALQVALVDAIPEDADHPWILQFYLQDDYDLTQTKHSIATYGTAEALATPYASVYRDLFDEHLFRMSRPEGAFNEESSPWRSKIRRIRAMLYRRVAASSFSLPDDLEKELAEVLDRFQTSLDVADVAHTQLDLTQFREWMLPWLNPRPSITNESTRCLLDIAAEAPSPMPFGYDVGEDLLLAQPGSDAEKGVWWFDGLPHQLVSIQGLRRVPDIGHLSAERRQGDRIQTLFDAFPGGTILAMTVIVKPQHEVMQKVTRIKKAAVGDSAIVDVTREQIDAVERVVARGNKLLPVSLALYIRGSDLDELRASRTEACMTLLSNGLQPIFEEADLLALDSYMRNLPMAYDHSLDAKRRCSRLMLSKDVANLLPIYGRSRGYGNPGFVFFNRGAEPFCFDPLATEDRKKNAHLLVLGPSGAGKSAMLVYLLQQAMARHRPRLFIVEAGGSFELLGEHFKAHGLSVHQVKLQPDNDVRLPPYLHAGKVVDSNDLTDESRDYLGEMEIIARIMITGGDPREQERLTRADRMLIRNAILDAGRFAADEGRDTLTQDVVKALRQISSNEHVPNNRRSRAQEMSDGMALFTTGIAGHFFNRPGAPWPDADVTIFELGLLAREGYEDQLTVAYLSLMSHINDLVEKHQRSERQTLVVTDEGHVILTHPLLANYVVKITKMWRKFGAWFWIATQNLADFPDQSRRMLNMIEWWLCLAMPKDEIDQLARFRELTDDQRLLLASARKQPGKYVEGVVLSDELQSLFRNVPPRLSLALAMTEKHEKVARRKLMDDLSCTEYEAACMMANEPIDTV
ncbi:MAG: conjugative transfer ATPase [Gammaproteobacteria bacterium]|nr:conjugative transfer ATPase [Gammaproteobacteria bacterium]